MADIRLLQWSDMHGNLGKYRGIINFVRSRDDIGACLDLGDMVDSKGIVSKVVANVLGEDADPEKYAEQVRQVDKAIQLVEMGQLSNEDFAKKFSRELLESINAVSTEIVRRHQKTYQSIDSIFADAGIPIYFVPGNHDLPHKHIPIRNAKNAVLASLDGPFFINNLKVFAGVNTGYSIPGFPAELCTHLDSGISIKQLEEKVRDIKDPEKREEQVRKLLEQDRGIYRTGSQYDFDLFIGHGQVGDRLTRRSTTIDDHEWQYPAGAYYLAKEKKVPYLAGHTHHAIRSTKDGFPGFVSDWDLVYEHVFDSGTKKLKETIVYEIEKID